MCVCLLTACMQVQKGKVRSPQWCAGIAQQMTGRGTEHSHPI